MPQLEAGDLKTVAGAAERVAKVFAPLIEDGWDVVALTASCGLMMKFEWPLMLPEDHAVGRLSAATKDICRYVVELSKAHGLTPGLQALEGSATVHHACRARAQNMGAKSAEMLRMIPGLKVDLVELLRPRRHLQGHEGHARGRPRSAARPLARPPARPADALLGLPARLQAPGPADRRRHRADAPAPRPRRIRSRCSPAPMECLMPLSERRITPTTCCPTPSSQAPQVPARRADGGEAPAPSSSAPLHLLLRELRHHALPGAGDAAGGEGRAAQSPTSWPPTTR